VGTSKSTFASFAVFTAICRIYEKHHDVGSARFVLLGHFGVAGGATFLLFLLSFFPDM
jgi:hypothetical protein